MGRGNLKEKETEEKETQDRSRKKRVADRDLMCIERALKSRSGAEYPAREGDVTSSATPNPFLLNELCAPFHYSLGALF